MTRFVLLKVANKPDIVRVVKVSHIVFFEPSVSNPKHTFIQLTGVGNQFVADVPYTELYEFVLR